MTSSTLSELLRLQEEASTATKPGRFLEIGEEYEAYHRFIAAARNFDLKTLATQYEAMRAWFLKGDQHLVECDISVWEAESEDDIPVPECTCGLSALRASLDTKARGDGNG